MISNPFKSTERQLLELGAITPEEYVIMRSDGKFSKKIVIAAVIGISFYAIVMMQFAYLNIVNHTNVFPPVEFTTGYFAFWTVEIVMLSSIKRHRIKNKHEREDSSGDILARVLDRVSPAESAALEPIKEEIDGNLDGSR